MAREKASEIRLKMPYGKYKGIEIWRLPSDYLWWICKYFDRQRYCKAADQEWKFRERFNCHFDKVKELK